MCYRKTKKKCFKNIYAVSKFIIKKKMYILQHI